MKKQMIDKLKLVSLRIPEYQYLWLKEQKYNSVSGIVRAILEKEIKQNETKN